MSDTMEDAAFCAVNGARCADLRAALAASQAREKRLREAFSRFVDEVQCFDIEFPTSDDEHEAEEAVRRARAALAEEVAP